MCSGVHDWQVDPAVEEGNSHNLKAVTCREYVASLERAVVELSADKDLPDVLLKTCATAWREGR